MARNGNGKSHGATVARSSPARIVSCEQCPLRQQPTFRNFSAEELAFMASFKSGEIRFEAGATVLMQGAHSAHIYTLLSGWAMRYKTLPDGRRQVLNFAFPGDLVGLQSSILQEMQHSVETLTECVFCVFERERLWDLFTRHPSLAFDVTWLAGREEHLVGENLVSVGRRRAIERVAFLLLHLYLRAEQVGLAKEGSARFPFTQQDIADTLGMSLVHTNKTIRRLTQAGAVRWKDGLFKILSPKKLGEIALYDFGDRLPRPLI